MTASTFTRRAACAGAAALFAGASPIERAFAAEAARAAVAEPARVGRDRLWLRRTTGAEVEARFRGADGFDAAQVLMLSWFMRDLVDADRAVWIEPRLFDLVAAVQSGMSLVHGGPLPLVLLSGYRTPAHNAALEGAARNSMHLYGYAADLRAPGYSPRAIALAASFFARGGIGLYDGFTHLDVWKVRTWAG
ncbi:YcbK family protein [Lichenibacterium ramalinae]|uniref:Murein endopeptidase K n=1 Tax=Lichenibacterium ramalinae TaxID=2316527 RepID=A0A4V1RI05_9HYPH|nr:DUF882 domain-containing protein [Lichenibacterium ramalinae]RYB01867.1 DUF882 domain-containing protein [Lichenibacterium ramalinae]